MFESNKGMVLRECDRLNETRGVMTGSVSHTTFFHRIQGDLLISGYLASNLSLITRPGSGISMPEGYADDPSVVSPGTIWPDPRDVRRSGGTDRHFGFA